ATLCCKATTPQSATYLSASDPSAPEVRMSPVTEGITRREFLEVSAAAGLACVAGAACRTAAPAGRARGLAGPAIAPFALQEATVADLQQGMESGKYTAQDRKSTRLNSSHVA